MMQFFDAVQIADASTRRRTADGYLVAMARAARAGIQVYAGREVGRPDLAEVRVYRPADEVFSRDSLATYAHRPLTNDHPAEAVTPANWKTHAVGFVGDEVARDGEHVRIPLMLADAAAIAALEAGKRELSAGYICRLDWTSGTTPEGQAYDAVQRDIRINHVALVDAGRAGPAARIDDGERTKASDSTKEPPMTLKTVIVDGLSIEVTDQGAQIIGKLQSQLTDAAAKAAATVADHEKALAAKDAEIAKRDAQIDDLKGKVLDTAALDAKVQERADLISAAKAIVGDSVDIRGKSDAEIRKAVVVAKLGDAAVKDKPAAYVDARFDILVEGLKDRDPIRDAARGGTGGVFAGDARAKAFADQGDYLTNAWKGSK